MATFVHAPTYWAFDTRLTSLATATTLAGATRYDFPAITIKTETSPTFLSAIIEVTAHYNGTTSRAVTARLGIKLGAVAFSDVDYTIGIGNTGTCFAVRYTRDATSYFTTNWSGTSMTSQVGVAFATSTDAQSMINITACLILTYTYDSTSGTYYKTVRIPVQAESTTLTTSSQELGVDGTNAAPANQIPALDTFLPEASKSYENVFIQFVGTNSRATTTDFMLQVEIDSGGLSNRAVLEAALGGTIWFRDNFNYSTGTFSPASAHALKAASDVTARFACLGAVMFVTYGYDRATTTSVINSLYLPMALTGVGNFWTSGTTTANTDRFALELYVEEPSTITLVQSGVELNSTLDGVAGSFLVKAGGQTERTYAYPAIGTVDGNAKLIHRCDHGTSPWALVRGKNTLYLDVYCTTAGIAQVSTAMAIVNYTSGIAGGGIGVHNQSVCWNRYDFLTSGSSQSTMEVAAATQKFPVFTGLAHWFINSISTASHRFGNTTGGLSVVLIGGEEEILSGELTGNGWLNLQYAAQQPGTLAGPLDAFVDATPYFNRTDVSTGKLVPTDTSRKVRWQAAIRLTSTTGLQAAWWWVTFHGVLFTVSGTVSGYPSGDGSGITVEIWNATTDTLVTTATTTAGGAYTAYVYDNVDTYFAEARVDGTHVGRSNNVVPTPV